MVRNIFLFCFMFVLAPLADVSPDKLIDGKTAAAWLEEIDSEGIEPI